MFSVFVSYLWIYKLKLAKDKYNLLEIFLIWNSYKYWIYVFVIYNLESDITHYDQQTVLYIPVNLRKSAQNYIELRSIYFVVAPQGCMTYRVSSFLLLFWPFVHVLLNQFHTKLNFVFSKLNSYFKRKIMMFEVNFSWTLILLVDNVYYSFFLYF